jgi:hypothetical protein
MENDLGVFLLAYIYAKWLTKKTPKKLHFFYVKVVTSNAVSIMNTKDTLRPTSIKC